MPKTIITHQDGTTQSVEIQTGDSLMKRLRELDVPGIVAECGGSCACATCQVIIAPEWRERLAPPADGEASILDTDDFAAGRRLSCQIEVTEEIDALVLSIPSTLY